MTLKRGHAPFPSPTTGGSPSSKKRAPARFRAALALVAAVLAAACAPTPTVEHDGLGFDERRARLRAVPAWEMRGRLLVETGERAIQGRFRWLQEHELSTLSIRSGPFGAAALEIAGSPQEMIVTARGEQRVLEDPELDLSALLGWWMPVESLNAWLLGLPDAEHPADPRIGPGGVLASLEQRLWRLDYESYQLVAGVLVPRRIEMAHDDLEVRLVVDDWNPGQPVGTDSSP